MTLRERIEAAIAENKIRLDQLHVERDDLFKKKHFNDQLKYAYNRKCDEIQDLRCKISTYLEVLKWIEEEDK